jgi:mono/diheme cytochrome c family protein
MSEVRRYLTRTVAAAWHTFAALDAGAQPRGETFTAAQADAGRGVYATSCAVCHGADLAGVGGAPPLAGAQFVARWGGRTPGELVGLTRVTMPPGSANVLPESTYVEIVAYVLAMNGSPAGAAPLTAASAATIETLLPRAAPAAAAVAASNTGAAAPLGVIVRGEATRVTSVTAAKLRNPPPATGQ